MRGPSSVVFGAIGQNHLRLQHPMHQLQDSTIWNPLSQSVQQALMVHAVEELRQVDIDRDAESLGQVLLRLVDGGLSTSAWTKTMTARVKCRLEDGLQHLENRLLHPAVDDIRDTQPPLPTAGFGNPNPADVSGSVGPRQQFTSQVRQKPGRCRHDFIDAASVHARRPLVPGDVQQRLCQVWRRRC